MRMFILLLAIVTGSIMYTGCNIINPKEQIPTYVHIDSITMTPQGDTFGSTTHKITNVWVYYNNQSLGAFEMPLNLPVIAEKPGVIRVAPGIDFNGLSGFKGIYPFYTFDSLVLNPDPGKIVHFAPKTKYSAATRLLYNNNFDAGVFFEKFAGDTAMVKTTDPQYVFESTGSGFIYLNGPKKSSENISSSQFKPTVGQQNFIELNYKCSIPFTIGLATFFDNGSDYKEYFAGINPKSDWTKIYIGIQDFVNAHQGAKFYVIVRAGTDNDEENGWISIDNLKVVGF